VDLLREQIGWFAAGGAAVAFIAALLTWCAPDPSPSPWTPPSSLDASADAG
jgi:hypothetical protein